MLTKMYVWATTLGKSDEGATAVEYGIMVAGIAVVIIAIVFALGGELGEMFGQIRDAILERPAAGV